LDRKKTAVGYIRVSTEEQVREGYSLDNQTVQIEKECSYKDWELLKIFHDKGISGASLEKRDGLKSMLSFIDDNDVDYLIVYKLSRLSRKVSDVVNIAEFLKKNSTALISIEDRIDTSSKMGEYFLVLASIFADMERENIIVQVKGGMSQKARDGEWNGGKPPLGYDLIEKKLVVNEEQAQTVQYIFTEYLRGSGYKAIAAVLNDEGLKTGRKSTFSGVSVKDILRNPTYIGKIRWGRRNDWGVLHDSKRKRKYDKDPIVSDGKHDGIVDEETFNKVQELINTNPRHKMKRFNANHLLSGLLRCPVCDYGMSYQPASSKGKTYGYYVCNQWMNKHGSCKPNGVRKDAIEEEFLTIFEKIVNEPDFKEIMMSSLNNSDSHIEYLDKLLKRKSTEIKEHESRQNSLIDELVQGDERYKERMRKKIQVVEDEIASLEEEVQKLEREKKALSGQRLDHDEIIELLGNVGKIIRLLDAEAQQTLVRKLIRNIKIQDKHIIEVNFSFQQSFRIGGDTGNRIINKGKFFCGIPCGA
jgi:site-specific DNA recombinase